MKQTIVTLLALAGLTLGAVLTGQAAAADASASAEIIAPIAMINVNGSSLAFGKIVPWVEGTVTVDPSSARSASAGLEVVPSSAASAAQFEVSGQPGNTFSIALPAASTISNGTASMTVDQFTSDPSGTGLLDGTGKQTLNVGGTLHVAAGQTVGAYTGTFTITVAYN